MIYDNIPYEYHQENEEEEMKRLGRTEEEMMILAKEKQLQIRKYNTNKKISITEKVIDDFLFSSGTKLTEQHKALFKAIALRNGLDPFKREIYAVPYKNKQTGEIEISIITGYQIYLQRAERTGLLNGWKVESIKNSKGQLLGAKITIYRKDWKNPFEWEVYLKEFYKNTKIWKTMPEFMIKKVAIAQGFRLAFPEELGGLPYIKEELGIEEPVIEVINEEPKKSKFDVEKFKESIKKIFGDLDMIGIYALDYIKDTLKVDINNITRNEAIKIYNHIKENQEKIIEEYEKLIKEQEG